MSLTPYLSISNLSPTMRHRHWFIQTLCCKIIFFYFRNNSFRSTLYASKFYIWSRKGKKKSSIQWSFWRIAQRCHWGAISSLLAWFYSFWIWYSTLDCGLALNRRMSASDYEHMKRQEISIWSVKAVAMTIDLLDPLRIKFYDKAIEMNCFIS